MPERIPEPTRKFLARHIYSVGQLEILLHARSRPNELLTPETVAREERVNPERASEVLGDLAEQGLLEEAPEGFRYNPKQDLARQIDAVANAYRSYRVTVINLIFSTPSEELRNFADSFRVRKHKK
ncbi:MAG TPA: hypothetical protein VE174_12045 [Actinomycetota bacterium]|nr:hypothetical protein [Actinomycetota bacterium]